MLHISPSGMGTSTYPHKPLLAIHLIFRLIQAEVIL